MVMAVAVLCAPGVEVVAVLVALAEVLLVVRLFFLRFWLLVEGFPSFAYVVLSAVVLLVPVLLVPVLLFVLFLL